MSIVLIADLADFLSIESMIKHIPILYLLFILLSACQQNSKTDKAAVLKPQEQKTPDTILFQNDTLAIYKIDSVSFFKAKDQLHIPQDTLVYFEDIDKVKELLKNRVTFAGYNAGIDKIDSTISGSFLSKIVFENGDSLVAGKNDILSEIGFWRYYPTEDILLCEGGHSSDYPINLKTGEMGGEVVGNPAYIVESPNKRFRLNGWFPGQECSDYFIQQNQSGTYIRYVGIPMDLTKESFDLCNISSIFWDGDHILYFRNDFYKYGNDPRSGFFKLKIK
ncbi:hypothetical protein ACUY1X_15305 [Sphingobacterium kyonggiense]